MRLAYSDTRTPPAVVLLHGFPLSREMWVQQLGVLGANYRVIAPDLRGHGDSPAPKGTYTMDEMADDVVELLDHLGVNGPVALGGLSMGGYVALSLVLRHPERVAALLLMDTRAGADTPEAAKGREETARQVLRDGNGDAIIQTMVPRLFGRTTREKHPDRVEAMLAVMEKTSAQGIAGALRGMAVRPDRRVELAGIKVPTLVMVGEDDIISPPEEVREMAAAIPSARFEVIPAAGHMAPFENPDAANRAILGFLEGLDLPGASPASRKRP